MTSDENFVLETIRALNENGYTELFKDVKWIGSRDGKFAISWKQFVDNFKGLIYDSGYGAAEIANDLVIVMKDGCWFDRGEYDGSEWWSFNETPVLQPDAKPFDKVCVNQSTGCSCGWESLEAINR